MKKIIMVASVWMMMVGVSQALNQVQWGTVDGQIYNHTGVGGTLLNAPITNASQIGASKTALIQLIYAGANGVINVATNPVTLGTLTGGVTVDDQVVAWSYVGQGYEAVPNFAAGNFTGSAYTNSLANGAAYYMRAWELPTGSVGTGYIPTNNASVYYYGNSELFYISGNGTIKNVDNFYTTTDFATTSSISVTSIPEPGSLQLLVFLGSAFAMRRRMRKSIG